MKAGEDKKWKNVDKEMAQVFDDQLGENASEEWDSEAYRNTVQGKNMKGNRPRM